MKILLVLAVTIMSTSLLASDAYRCELTAYEKDAAGAKTFVNDQAHHLMLGSTAGGHLGTLRVEGKTKNSTMTLEASGEILNQNQPQAKIKVYRSVFTRGEGTQNVGLCDLVIDGEGQTACEAEGFLFQADCQLFESDSRAYKRLKRKDDKRKKAKICGANLVTEGDFSNDDRALVSSDLRQKNFGIHRDFSPYRAFDLKLTAKEKGFWFFKKCTVTGSFNDPVLSYRSRQIKVRKFGACKRALKRIMKKIEGVEVKCKTRDLRGL